VNPQHKENASWPQEGSVEQELLLTINQKQTILTTLVINVQNQTKLHFRCVVNLCLFTACALKTQ